MKKLHLDVESLHVESFATDEGSGSRGTVHGRSAQDSEDSHCYGTLCWPGCVSESDNGSCDGGASCSCLGGPGHCGLKTSNACEQ
jgi:hypothetical protein